MKNLLVMVALTAGLISAATAGSMPTQNSDWSKISRDSRVYFELPQFQLSYGWFVRAGGVCVDGDVLRTKKMKKQCIQTIGRDDECVKWKNVYPSKAMVGTRSVCTAYEGESDGGGCRTWRQVPYSINTSYDIEVSRKEHRGQGEVGPGRHLFTKTFTIKSCN